MSNPSVNAETSTPLPPPFDRGTMAEGVEMTSERIEIWKDVLEMYECRPTQTVYRHYADNCEFEDPIGYSKGKAAVESQFYAMAKLFKGATVQSYLIRQNAQKKMEADLNMMYVIPVKGETQVKSVVVLLFDEEGNVIRHEDLWDGKPIPRREDGVLGGIKQTWRTVNGKFVEWLYRPKEV